MYLTAGRSERLNRREREIWPEGADQMNNFTYYTPTKVVFGRGSEGQTGALVRERGCKKVLLHYGGAARCARACWTG